MSGNLTCPRCPRTVRATGEETGGWVCAVHGPVPPLYAALMPGHEVIRLVAERSGVPVWVPWPLPVGWLVTGVRWAGDDVTGPVACVTAISGPNPLPSDLDLGALAADVLIVAEQPGVGLGARLAGLDGVDPGEALREVIGGPPHLKLSTEGHDLPLWAIEVPDGVAAYVGEAEGVWLWVLTWPAEAAAVLLEPFSMIDMRYPDRALMELPFGALTPRIE